MAFPLEPKRWQFCLVNMQMSWYLRKRICPTNGVAHDLCETINAAPPFFLLHSENISGINDIIAIFISRVRNKFVKPSGLTYNELKTENPGSANICMGSSKIGLATIGIMFYTVLEGIIQIRRLQGNFI